MHWPNVISGVGKPQVFPFELTSPGIFSPEGEALKRKRDRERAVWCLDFVGPQVS